MVLRTSDASRIEIKLSLSETLNALKDSISQTNLGPIQRGHQRLFHLGRELKTGGRTLRALGFGKHNNFLVHLHSTKPTTLVLSSDDEEDDTVIENVVAQDISSNKPFSPSIANQVATAAQIGQARQSDVVDLLDDSDDEDIAVVETVSASEAIKRRRLR